MFRLALFASGSGTNVQNICEYFQNHISIKPEIVLSDKEDAYALERAKHLNIKREYFNYISTSSEELLAKIKDHEVTHIILAGYLRLVPSKIIKTFSFLLPKFLGNLFYAQKITTFSLSLHFFVYIS